MAQPRQSERPLNPAESVDTDHDGVGNNAGTDDDGDGVMDSADPFSMNPTESADTDQDGVGNTADTDDDNDGIADDSDAYPLEKDGKTSGQLSRRIAKNPALRPVLGPVRDSSRRWWVSRPTPSEPVPRRWYRS